MFERFADETRSLLHRAREEARRLGAEFITPDHLVLGLLESRLAPLFPRDFARPNLQARLPSTETSIPFSPQAKEAVERAASEAAALGHEEVRLEHLLIGTVPDDKIRIAALGLLAALPAVPRTPPPPPPQRERDLTVVAAEPRWRHVVDRPSVSRPLLELLRQGKSVALVGPRGAGKTALVLGLARERAGGFRYRALDFRLLDPIASGTLIASWGEGIVRFMPDAELLAACRAETFDDLFARPVPRLIFEFENEGEFERRYPALASEWIKLQVDLPGPAESAELIRSAFPGAGPDVLEEALRLSAERIASPRPPWSTIKLLGAAGPDRSVLSVRLAAGL